MVPYVKSTRKQSKKVFKSAADGNSLSRNVFLAASHSATELGNGPMGSLPIAGNTVKGKIPRAAKPIFLVLSEFKFIGRSIIG